MKTSKAIIFTVITLVMLNNVEHLAWVHYGLANKLLPVVGDDWLNKAHSILVVIIFEVVVVTFAILGKKGFSLFFTFCIWIISMIYYDAPDLFITGQWQKLTAATVYSTIFTISIYMFSEMLAEWYQDERMVKILQTKLIELQADLKQARAGWTDADQKCKRFDEQLKESEATASNLQSELQNLKSQILTYQRAEEKAREALRCPHCRDFIADSEGQLRSHKGHCPSNPKSNTKTSTE